MEGSNVTAADVTNVPHEYSSSNPSNHTLRFPLGTALLVVVIFSLSCVFSCFYHWDKVQAFRRRLRHRRRRSLRQEGGDDIDRHQGMPSSHSKLNISTQMEEREQSTLLVIMPGDRISTFIARPCPCELLPPLVSCPLVVVDMNIVELPSVLPPPPGADLEN